MTLRTDAELDQALTALAQREGLSRQEVVRRAVLDRYQRTEHREAVDDSTRRAMLRWQDVLDRLGRA